MKQPLVTVIALCYEHEAFVEEALESVHQQSYGNIELIIVDDASKDGSVQKIEAFIQKHPQTKFIRHAQNTGNCKSFNDALREAKGEFVIDFATDDILLPEMVETQVKVFSGLGALFGAVFSDALVMTSNGEILGNWSKKFTWVPDGEIYKEVLRKHYICPPTVMIRKNVLDELGGYDERLSFEDFDLWLRTSRNYRFWYINKPLIRYRTHKKSLSASFYRKRNHKVTASVLRVCQKALWLNRNKEEDAALAERIRYEMRHAYLTANFEHALDLYKLLEDMKMTSLKDRFWEKLIRSRFDLYTSYKLYLRLRHGIKN